MESEGTLKSTSFEKSPDKPTPDKHSKVDKKKYIVKKRPPPKAPQRANDIYISDHSNFKAQTAKCQRLFDDGEFNEVYLHGLGSSIPRAINVALQLKTFYQGTVDYTVNTSTIQLIDDLIPLDDSTPPSQQVRKVSSVDIRVFRTVKIP